MGQDTPVPPPQTADPAPASIKSAERDPWKKAEQAARLLSLVAIPVLIAVFGSVIQRSLAQRNLNRDYVQLAVSILTRDKTEVDAPLRMWAIDLLNENSPTKFTPDVLAQLKSGALSFPSMLGERLAGGTSGAVAMAPDGTTVAIGQEDGGITTWNSVTGDTVATYSGHAGVITSLNYSPDGEFLLSASMDGTVRVWELLTGQSRFVLRPGDGGVLGAVFSPDGAEILTRSRDILRRWSAATGELLEARTLGVIVGSEG
jgi:hypothetical protein